MTDLDLDRLQPEFDIFRAFTGDTSGAILHQEKVGLAALVDIPVIPVRGTEGFFEPLFERAGIQLGPVCEKDPLFREVTLPEGWTRVLEDGRIRFKDEQGRCRVQCHYKAAFYDRKASVFLTPRFRLESYLDDLDDDVAMACAVADAGTEVYRSPVLEVPPWEPGPERARERDKARAVSEMDCMAWLDKHGYCRFGDPMCYWDGETHPEPPHPLGTFIQLPDGTKGVLGRMTVSGEGWTYQYYGLEPRPSLTSVEEFEVLPRAPLVHSPFNSTDEHGVLFRTFASYEVRKHLEESNDA